MDIFLKCVTYLYSLSSKEMLHPDKTEVILHPYLPIPANSLQIGEVLAISGFKSMMKSHLPDK